MVAQDAQYQVFDCSIQPWKKAPEMIALTLIELVIYIEEVRDPEVCPVFCLSELLKIYSVRLTQLGVETCTIPNSTWLKETLLKKVPDLKAHTEGNMCC